MRKSSIIYYFPVVFLLLFSSTIRAQVESVTSDVLFYKKKELNTGFRFGGNSEREELRTDESRRYEELTTGSATFQFNNRFWNYLDYKQDELDFNFEVGPFGGYGNWLDSSYVENTEADHNMFGLRTSASVEYLQRYYFNEKNYTIVKVNGRARLDWFNQNSTGTTIDSLGVITEFDEKSTETKFRYGFEARAGWGFGRLNVMNNYMMAQHIIEKYYAGRLFSEKEIRLIADEISIVKEQRNVINGHNNEIESQIISDFFNEKLMLTEPEELETDWELGEFLPRFHGNRLEIGPYFRYYNQEPDFIYGGYIQYENAKYCTFNWNRNLTTSLNYNRYKKNDWVNAEINLGWSYFPNLKRQFDFGVKYVPGVEVNDFQEIGEFNHGVVPYFGYFSQINSKSRVNFTFAYRISADEKMMLPGPEFSLAFYKSRY